LGFQHLRDDFSHHLADQKPLCFFNEEFNVIVDFEEPFGGCLMILAFVVELAHHIALRWMSTASIRYFTMTFWINFLNFYRWDAGVLVWVIITPLIILFQ
jgi:hypothetical protein